MIRYVRHSFDPFKKVVKSIIELLDEKAQRKLVDGRPKHIEICVDGALYLQPKKEDRKKEKKKK